MKIRIQQPDVSATGVETLTVAYRELQAAGLGEPLLFRFADGLAIDADVPGPTVACLMAAGVNIEFHSKGSEDDAAEYAWQKARFLSLSRRDMRVLDGAEVKLSQDRRSAWVQAEVHVRF